MRKVITLAVVLLVLTFLPAGADKPGRIQELEARVAILEGKLQDYENIKVEVSCLESYVNFILSDEFVDMIIDQIPDNQ